MINQADKIETQLRYYHWSKQLLWLLLVVVIGIFCWGLFATLQQVKNQGQLLVDCTTPVGHCYQDANRRSSGAVKLISENNAKAAAAATVCAKQPENKTYEQVYNCTLKELGNGR